MPVPLSSDTPPELIPLAWLLGRWEGAGVLSRAGDGSGTQFGQAMEFSHDGREFLTYTASSWALDESGATTHPLDVESGYWRAHLPAAGQLGGAPAPGPVPVELEVLLSHPTGIVEVLLGTVTGPRIELATDVVARTLTAHEYTAASRMYGLVEGDLLWALDIAADGQPMRSYASARLKRVG